MQAVREGFVAATVRGQYQIGPALLGIIKFLNSRQDKLPIYDTPAQCSSMTGIPLGAIRQARRIKQLGSNNLISLDILLRVLFADNGENWTEMQSKFAALRQKQLYEQENGMWIAKSEAAHTIKRGLAGFFRSLEQRSNVDLPPTLVGLEASEIQRELVKSDDELKNNLLKEWSLLARNGEAKDAR